MATYPSIGMQAKAEPINNRIVNVSDAGTVRSIDLGAVTAYRITVTHPMISSTDKGTLETFYSTNKNNTNAITIDGTTYDVQFDRDYSVESVNSTLFTLTVSMSGVKQ